ncbi:hypothetical protein DFH09DRAFT_1170567 [Mycena vulgaris]|nr:hypothetical protein DFH09DRAFT_1170567 [Mycena vulgaris]
MKAPARPRSFVLLLKRMLAGCEAVGVAGWEACAWRSLSRSRRLGPARPTGRRWVPRTDTIALAHLFGFTHARRHQERQEDPRSRSPPASPSCIRHALVVLKNFSTARKQKGTTSPLACAPPPDDSTLEETRGRNAVDKDIQRMPSGPRTAAIERRRARCSPPRPPRR